MKQNGKKTCFTIIKPISTFAWETPHHNATSINYNYKNNNRKENRQKKLKDVNAKQWKLTMNTK